MGFRNPYLLRPSRYPSAPNPARSCYSKKRYPDEADANRVARVCEKQRGDALKVYACEHCGGYHLARKKVAG